MANTLQIEDGATTVSLASVTSPGIRLVNFAPPPPLRQVARTSGWPYVDGLRTVAGSFIDGTATITCTVQGSSIDNVAAQMDALETLLQNAIIYEEQRAGEPVRLAWKPQNATNTAYWVITGVTQWPTALWQQPTDMDADLYNNYFTFVMILTLEPIAHASTMTTVQGPAAGLTNKPVFNTIGVSTLIPGDSPAPLSLQLTNTQASGYNQIWFALLPQAAVVSVQDEQTALFAGAFGLKATSYTLTSGSPSAVLTFVTTTGLTASLAYPSRIFARVQVTAGTPASIQLRSTVYVGGLAVVTLPWVTLPNLLSTWLLIDVGSTGAFTSLLNRTAQTGGTMVLNVQAQLLGTTSTTILIDYAEVVPYTSFVKLQGGVVGALLANTQTAVVEGVALNGSFAYPRQAVQSYFMDAAGVLQAAPARVGALGKVAAGTTPSVWIACFRDSNNTHIFADTATLTVKALAMYASTIRGAG